MGELQNHVHLMTKKPILNSSKRKSRNIFDSFSKMVFADENILQNNQESRKSGKSVFESLSKVVFQDESSQKSSVKSGKSELKDEEIQNLVLEDEEENDIECCTLWNYFPTLEELTTIEVWIDTERFLAVR